MSDTPRAVVVGAGPAGSVAAMVLARAGVRVQLVDRAAFPRDKLCGDTLNPGTVSIVERLGHGERLRASSRPLTGMTLTGPGGVGLRVEYPKHLHGAAILRRDFDAMLLDGAIAAGADFMPCAAVLAPLVSSKDQVTGVRLQSRSDVPADIVIAADGRCSRVARVLGLARAAARPARWAFGRYFTGIDALTTSGEMHIRDDGYIGIAPLADGIANVCVVRERANISPRYAAEHVIAQAIAADPVLAARCHGARAIGPASTLGPLAVDAAAAGHRGLLLAGDAAGFIDPMTGDGLRFALRGGELAAETALEELRTGRAAHGKLHAARRREFAGKWRFNRALRRLVSSPTGVRLGSIVAAQWPLPFEMLVTIAGDLRLAERQPRAHAA